MNTSKNPSALATPAYTPAPARYQVYYQTRTGVFTPGFKSDSAGEAVEAFLKQAPAYEGGEIRLWNHRSQELSASVVWRNEQTDFGFPVNHRLNLFHDRLLGVIARQLEEHETLRVEVREGAGLSVDV